MLAIFNCQYCFNSEKYPLDIPTTVIGNNYLKSNMLKIQHFFKDFTPATHDGRFFLHCLFVEIQENTNCKYCNVKYL